MGQIRWKEGIKKPRIFSDTGPYQKSLLFSYKLDASFDKVGQVGTGQHVV
jgi:hypothetical protein